MSFCIDDERLLEKYKAIWKIRTYGDKVYTNLRGLNMPEDVEECEYFFFFLNVNLLQSFLFIPYML